MERKCKGCNLTFDYYKKIKKHGFGFIMESRNYINLNEWSLGVLIIGHAKDGIITLTGADYPPLLFEIITANISEEYCKYRNKYRKFLHTRAKYIANLSWTCDEMKFYETFNAKEKEYFAERNKLTIEAMKAHLDGGSDERNR
jgi:hypothetical protein